MRRSAAGSQHQMGERKNRPARRFRKAVDEKPGKARRIEGDQDDLYAAKRPPDELNPRAKSSRKGKVTADKWNQ